MNSKSWILIILAILASFMVINAIVPSNDQGASTGSTEAPASPEAQEEDLWITIDCDSPYHAYIELGNGSGVMTDYAEFTRKGHYYYHAKGINLSMYATVQKIDPDNMEDQLTMEIYGKKLSKKLDTFYPGWELELEATGAEDKALQEAEE